MQGLEGQTHARNGTLHKVLHQHIGLAKQARQHLRCLRVLEVERQAFFRAIDLTKCDDWPRTRWS